MEHVQLLPVQLHLLLFKDSPEICLPFFKMRNLLAGFFQRWYITVYFHHIKSSLCLFLTTDANSSFSSRHFPGYLRHYYISRPGRVTIKKKGESSVEISPNPVFFRDSLGNNHHLINEEWYCCAITEMKDTFGYAAWNTTGFYLPQRMS